MNPTAARTILAVGALLLGWCVGSFVNVLIYRLPRGRSVVVPGSHCFCCGTLLAARDNIPLLSYLLAGRRCRYCGVALSGQYLWVEALTGVLFVAIFWRWDLTLTTLTYWVAAAALVAGTGTDLRYKIIPDGLNITVLVAALLGAWAGGRWPLLAGDGLPPLVWSVAGAVLGWLIFEAIVRLSRWWLGQEGMGGGDVLLAAGVGALFGPTAQFGAFFLLSIFAGVLIGGGLMALGRVSRRDPIPFGPFLVAGTLAVMLWPEIGDWVARLYGLGG
ncbi:MAG TPA: prepilin peptidase [Armatimonadetes bacterium]|nr:prepilin peptidase [Armatimonadota bacterium]